MIILFFAEEYVMKNVPLVVAFLCYLWVEYCGKQNESKNMVSEILEVELTSKDIRGQVQLDI